MSDVVISAEGLGKKYLIGHQAKRDRYSALRDVIGDAVRGLARSLRDMVRGTPIVAGDEVEEFWALKDVNFEIKRGDVVGIIGLNGAGKSTLLKVLSRITEPTTGKVEIKGRVASLLEVGTGFHPELTGRENIYLNGAILGMRRSEIRRKFDEIVAFAEVEKFLDTPVKRYSSGMYVRLAFAVAAHLEPEILVVDEVLAVGDAEFQKKCLGKMKDVASHGRTVLFVSHNMGIVRRLCGKGILLIGGRVQEIGDVASIVDSYQRSAPAAPKEVWAREKVPDRAHIKYAKVDVIETQTGSALKLQCELRSAISSRLGLEIPIRDSQGQPVAFASYGALTTGEVIHFDNGQALLDLVIDGSALANGHYVMSLYLSIPDVEFIDKVPDCLSFDIDAPPDPSFDRRLEQRWGFGSIGLRTLPARLHVAANGHNTALLHGAKQ
jgi:ABC-type polysaccharide/polyol phosphate transport system ATPase subunit